MNMTVNGVWPFEQTLHFNSRIGINLVKIGQVVSEKKLFNHTMTILVYSTTAVQDNSQNNIFLNKILTVT